MAASWSAEYGSLLGWWFGRQVRTRLASGQGWAWMGLDHQSWGSVGGSVVVTTSWVHSDWPDEFTARMRWA